MDCQMAWQRELTIRENMQKPLNYQYMITLNYHLRHVSFRGGVIYWYSLVYDCELLSMEYILITSDGPAKS